MNAGQFIQWQDLFVMVDDGSFPISYYPTVETTIREQAKGFPKGLAILVILPPETRPPPDDVKHAVKSSLTRLAPLMSSLAYVIEGTGFRGVAARATLVGMKIFSSRPYPIYVETSVKQALSKLVVHMVNHHAISLELVTKVIADARVTWKPTVPKTPKDREISLK